MVREEKRRVRKKLDRSTTKLKRLKIMEGKKEVGKLSQSSVLVFFLSYGLGYDVVALTEVSISVFRIRFCAYYFQWVHLHQSSKIYKSLRSLKRVEIKAFSKKNLGL